MEPGLNVRLLRFVLEEPLPDAMVVVDLGGTLYHLELSRVSPHMVVLSLATRDSIKQAVGRTGGSSSSRPG